MGSKENSAPGNTEKNKNQGALHKEAWKKVDKKMYARVIYTDYQNPLLINGVKCIEL